MFLCLWYLWYRGALLALYLPIYFEKFAVHPQVFCGQQSSTCLSCLVYVAHLQSYVVNFTVNNVHLTVDTIHFILSIYCALYDVVFTFHTLYNKRLLLYSIIYGLWCSLYGLYVNFRIYKQGVYNTLDFMYIDLKYTSLFVLFTSRSVL
jgi:hypothetical protein